jgi:hypothetical protein
MGQYIPPKFQKEKLSHYCTRQSPEEETPNLLRIAVKT